MRLVPLLAGIVVVSLAAACGSGGGTATPTATLPAGATVATDPLPKLDLAASTRGRTLGDASAPVEIIEYADFQCPYCKRAAQNIVPRLVQDYVNTGKASFEYRHFPIVDQAAKNKESHWASYASECANEQGKFWDYDATLWNNQKAENKGDFAKSKLEGFASDLGLDMSAFTPCLESDRYTDIVDQTMKQGEDQNVDGTPTFFINGQKLQSLTYSDFQKAVDQAASQ